MEKETYRVCLNDACLGVDPTKTFFPDGHLPVPYAYRIVPVAKKLMKKFDPSQIYFSEDEHPLGHICFADSYVEVKNGTVLTPKLVDTWTKEKIAPVAQFSFQYLRWYLRKIGSQVAWPVHGLPGSEKTRVHPELLKYGCYKIIVKGQNPRVDSYSVVKDALGFYTDLVPTLRSRGTLRVFVWGLAFDYCVGFTALDLIKEGFTVFMVQDTTASVNYPAGNAEVMKNKLLKAGVTLINMDQVVNQ